MYSLTTLPNGIRIVTEHVPYVQSVALGIWVDTGARDESPEVAGISHFIEHLLFKGTEKRTAQQIAEEFDAIGGQLNAVTDKEYTCYYAKVLPEHVSVALDVLADMLLNSVIDPTELEREKNVILEEIKHHEDTPEDLVHDLFLRTLWPDHPLGLPVIGRPEVISGLSRDVILNHVRQHYTPDRVIISAAGNMEHAAFVAEVERCFAALTGSSTPKQLQPATARVAEAAVSKDAEQVQICLGTRGCDNLDEDRYPLSVLDIAIGGGMSSRLFQEVREKRGLCYSIGSYTASYREGGVFAVYAGTSPETLDEVQALSRQELDRVARNGLDEAEIQRAKNQVRGAVLLGLDSMSGRMTRLGKTLMFYDRVIPPEEVVEKIERVNAADVRRVADSLFGSGEFAYAAVGPFDEEDEDE